MISMTIRKSYKKDLFLTRNGERVYFLWHHGEMVFNSLNYDEVSDKFNEIERKV